MFNLKTITKYIIDNTSISNIDLEKGTYNTEYYYIESNLSDNKTQFYSIKIENQALSSNNSNYDRIIDIV
jgi:hypothetical protein